MKRGQIWVETVIYTLIGLIIISILLSVSLPKINQSKDKAIISNSIESLTKINEQVYNALSYSGNQRQVILSLRRGEYIIDPVKESISYVLKATDLRYSEPGESIIQPGTDIVILTTEKNGKYEISLTLDYSKYDLSYRGGETIKTITPSPSPYSLLIKNLDGNKIDIEV